MYSASYGDETSAVRIPSGNGLHEEMGLSGASVDPATPAIAGPQGITVRTMKPGPTDTELVILFCASSAGRLV